MTPPHKRRLWRKYALITYKFGSSTFSVVWYPHLGISAIIKLPDRNLSHLGGSCGVGFNYFEVNMKRLFNLKRRPFEVLQQMHVAPLDFESREHSGQVDVPKYHRNKVRATQKKKKKLS